MDITQAPASAAAEIALPEKEGCLSRHDVRNRGVLLFKFLLVTAVVGPVSYVWFILPQPAPPKPAPAPVSEENFDKIEEGMTEGQVDEILHGEGVEVQGPIVQSFTEQTYRKRWTDRTRPDQWIEVQLQEEGSSKLLYVWMKSEGGF